METPLNTFTSEVLPVEATKAGEAPAQIVAPDTPAAETVETAFQIAERIRAEYLAEPDQEPIDGIKLHYITLTRDQFCCRVCHKIFQKFRRGKSKRGQYKHRDLRVNVCINCIKKGPNARAPKNLSRALRSLLKVQSLQEKLTTMTNVNESLTTISQFMQMCDHALGGPAGIAARYVACIDGLMEAGKLEKSSTLLLQLQKMRMMLERMNIEEDFTQLGIEEKRARMQIEFVKLLTDMEPAKRADFLKIAAAGFSTEQRSEMARFMSVKSPTLASTVTLSETKNPG